MPTRITLTRYEILNTYQPLARKIDRMVPPTVTYDLLYDGRYVECKEQVETKIATLKATINQLEDFAQFLGRLK